MMAIVNATGAIVAGAAANADYRPRTSPGHTTILQDSTVAAHKAALSADQRPHERQRRRGGHTNDSDMPPGAMFAASVAAADLAPKAQSREELARCLDSLKVRKDSSPPLSDRLA